MSTITFQDGIEAAIALLSTRVPATGGLYCSAAELRVVAGPTLSQQLYIDALRETPDTGGTFAEGIAHAQELLNGHKPGRDDASPSGWGLVETKDIEVWRQMFVHALERLVNADG